MHALLRAHADWMLPGACDSMLATNSRGLAIRCYDQSTGSPGHEWGCRRFLGLRHPVRREDRGRAVCPALATTAAATASKPCSPLTFGILDDENISLFFPVHFTPLRRNSSAIQPPLSLSLSLGAPYVLLVAWSMIQRRRQVQDPHVSHVSAQICCPAGYG